MAIQTDIIDSAASSSISFSTKMGGALLQPKAGAKDRKIFTEQLALLLETGNPLVESLSALTEQIANPAMIRIVGDLVEQVKGGRPFSSALASHPQLFSGTYVALIEASEEGGYMGKALRHPLEMEEKREELQSTLVSAFSYPVFLILFSVAVVVFILVFVFPKFAEMFSSIRDRLPPTTLVLMWLSELLREKSWLLIGAGAVVAVVGGTWVSRPAGIQWLHDLPTRLPGLRLIFLQIYLIQVMRILSLSLTNAVPLRDALMVCKGAIKNHTFSAFMEKIYNNVTEGQGIAKGFKETPFIPPLVRQMISTGEESGKLALVCGRIADHYQRELERKLDVLSKVIEPVMLLVMGLVVGVIVSSLILPIFQLSRAVH